MDGCAVAGCRREAKKRGWCPLHYERWRKYGAPEQTLDMDPPPEKIRAHIAAGTCPFCELGPFRVLAGHVWRAHGIDRRSFRDMGEIAWSTSICDPDHSDLMKSIAIENDSARAMDGKRVIGRANPISAAGRKRLAESGRAARNRRVPLSEHQVIASRLANGESAPAVAADYGVTANRIRQIAHAHT